MSTWLGDRATPLASIICHTYNHARYIQDALNGFLMQETDFPFEIIVHDDASSDGTADVLKNYQSRFPQLFRLVLQTENQYRKGKRPPRTTFPIARGKYIAFCEGDDFWIDPEKLQKQVSFLEREKDYVLVYTDSVSFSDNVVLAKDFGGATFDLTAEELKKAPPIFTLTTCFRNILDTPPEMSVIGYGDLFMWSRLGFHGAGKYMDDILPSFYRVHENGLESTADKSIKRTRKIESNFGMYLYYKRVGEPELSSYFLCDAFYMLLALYNISPKLIQIMKLITKVTRFSKNLLFLK